MATTGTEGRTVERFVQDYLRDRPVSARVPGGVLRVDRKLPYLLVHRSLPGDDDPAPAQLLAGEGAHALLSGEPEHAEANVALVRRLVEAGSEAFGAFLLLEVWAAASQRDRFRILGPRDEAPTTVAALREGLERLAALHPAIRVEVETAWDRHPPGQPPLLSVSECHELGCLLLGLEVPVAYRSEAGGGYPVFFRALRRAFSPVLRQAVFDFLRVQTRAHVANYHVLGPRTLDDSVWEADRALAEVEASYDLLLLVAPVDADDAWERFRAGGFREPPELHYRLLPVDPDLLKRRLYEIPLERVGDPAAGYLLRDKRDELDRQISLLAERGSPAFLASAIRLFGRVDEPLRALAGEVLAGVPAREGGEGARGVDAAGFKARAESEIATYRGVWPELGATVQVRPDVSGLLVSRGHLLVGSALRLDPERVEALVQHEVGTHVLTYWNGSAQRLRQLALGLADYDGFQEGLAILAEYLAGGLTASRLRLLAARVLAADSAQSGADFMETFRLLREEHGFTAASAYGVTVRVHAGGGFTRDHIYLRGLAEVLELVREGGELEPLFLGKLARKHIPVLEELRHRGVLRPPPLRPRFLDLPGAAERLERLRAGLPVAALAGAVQRVAGHGGAAAEGAHARAQARKEEE